MPQACPLTHPTPSGCTATAVSPAAVLQYNTPIQHGTAHRSSSGCTATAVSPRIVSGRVVATGRKSSESAGAAAAADIQQQAVQQIEPMWKQQQRQ
jgi:hypothetical protein